jgi:uncharacterized damage-inducible protein DinB
LPAIISINLAVKLQDTMKELLVQYAEYNLWANKLMAETMLPLKDELIHKELASSFPSLRATVYHCWSAEHIWLERLQLAEHPTWLEDSFDGTFRDGCAEWLRTSGELVQFVSKQFDDKALQHVCQYTDRAGNAWKMPVCQILQHIFNHATYHRGQMVTMLRQFGITKIPQTDFIVFARRK